jgi:hypothetical protein
MDPESRPSFESIFDEFRSNNYQLFPGADAAVIGEYVWGVLAWEGGSHLSESHSTPD